MLEQQQLLKEPYLVERYLEDPKPLREHRQSSLEVQNCLVGHCYLEEML